MMKAARRGAFDVLVVWAIDRFGRSMVGNLSDVLELDRIGVQVVSVREGWLDTGSRARQPDPARSLDHFTRIDADVAAWCTEKTAR